MRFIFGEYPVEIISVTINDPEKFDLLLREGMPEGRDINFVTKDGGTKSGSPIVMINWTTLLPDGTTGTCQAVTTVRCLIQALRLLESRYGIIFKEH